MERISKVETLPWQFLTAWRVGVVLAWSTLTKSRMWNLTVSNAPRQWVVAFVTEPRIQSCIVCISFAELHTHVFGTSASRCWDETVRTSSRLVVVVLLLLRWHSFAPSDTLTTSFDVYRLARITATCATLCSTPTGEMRNDEFQQSFQAADHTEAHNNQKFFCIDCWINLMSEDLPDMPFSSQQPFYLAPLPNPISQRRTLPKIPGCPYFHHGWLLYQELRGLGITLWDLSPFKFGSEGYDGGVIVVSRWKATGETI